MGEIFVGIDIGTSKVSTVVGRLNKSNELEILGTGFENCSGVKKGIIVDIESTSNAIVNSVRHAEASANMTIGSAYVNIMGTHVSVINNKSWLNISNENREITAKDVERLLYSAGKIPVPEDRQIIDIIPRQYIIDGYDGIIDPVGMVGVKFEVDADIVAGKITSVQNIIKSMERANIVLDGIIVEALSSGEILLTAEEKEIGTLLIDVGGGITDVSLFKNGKLEFYDSIPVGGDHITNDITIGFRTTYSEAEKLKRQYELALTSLIKNDQEITIIDANDNKKRNAKVSELVEIIEARVYEIFSICRELLEKAGVDIRSISNIVLAGGGISYVDGGVQLAQEVFNVPVRIAAFRTEGVSKLEYSTAAGIIRFVSTKYKDAKGCDVKVLKPKIQKTEPGFFEKIKNFFGNFF